MDETLSAVALRERVAQSYAELSGAVDALSVAQIERPGAQDEWSVKDILAHVSFWHNRLAALLEAVLSGTAPRPLSEPGEDIAATVDRVNAAHYAATKDLPAATVRADLEHSYARVVATLARLRDADLADTSALSTLLGGSLLELIAGDTYGHYEEHLPAIQAQNQ